MYQQLKELLLHWLGPLYDPFVKFAYIVFPFLDAHILNGLFIVSAIGLALWFYWRTTAKQELASALGFLKFLAPRHVFLHPSALVDYRFYLLNSFFISYLRIGTRVAGLVGLLHISDGVRHGLTTVFGVAPERGMPSIGVLIAYSLTMTLAVDFAKFFAHFLQHKVTLLWEFHKVHHSAEVLTPITNFRLHPVDMLLEQFIAATLVGVVAGAFSFFYPQGLVEITILNIGVLYFVYFLAANLRHSHIPLAFGYRISHILSSPYMHQIHHSSETRHWDKNFALIFSFWDWLFGSLYVPRGQEQFRLGLPGTENQRFDSVWKLYTAPFVGAVRLLLKGRPAAAVTITPGADDPSARH